MARAHASSVINAPIEQVWARIRDFNTLDDWHPCISSSVIEDGGPSAWVWLQGRYDDIQRAGMQSPRGRRLAEETLARRMSFPVG